MISLLPIHRVIVIISITYAALVAVIVSIIWKFSYSPTLYASIKVALAGATALNALLLGIIYIAWQWIWSKIPILNTILFPNLNGSWLMEIHWLNHEANGVVNAEVIISQSLVRISMEVSSKNSDSETMMAQPKKDPESGRPLLYYVYRVIPKQTSINAGHPYEGAAILKFSNSSGNSLHGNYFTSQHTRGHFILTKK